MNTRSAEAHPSDFGLSVPLVPDTSPQPKKSKEAKPRRPTLRLVEAADDDGWHLDPQTRVTGLTAIRGIRHNLAAGEARPLVFYHDVDEPQGWVEQEGEIEPDYTGVNAPHLPVAEASPITED